MGATGVYPDGAIGVRGYAVTDNKLDGRNFAFTGTIHTSSGYRLPHTPRTQTRTLQYDGIQRFMLLLHPSLERRTPFVREPPVGVRQVRRACGQL